MKVKFASKRRISLAVVTAIFFIAVFLILATKVNDNILHLGIDNAENSYVKFLDVGQGDSILIHSKGKYALIDTGPISKEIALAENLYRSGVKKIDVLIISHPHSDHTGGIGKLFEDFKVENLILPELSIVNEGMEDVFLAINEVNKSGGNVCTAVQGMNFTLGDAEITVLAVFNDMEDENDRSIFVMADVEGKKFLFTGDAEQKAEKQLINENLNLNCDVLKVGHHGSYSSCHKDFIKETSPKFAVISVGAANSYGHPHKETIAKLKADNRETFRTDKDSTVTFLIEDGKLSVSKK